MDDSRVFGRERLTFADEHDIDEFVDTLQKFERGEIDADSWRKFRLVRGTYGQRQEDVQMLRVKIPQGILTGGQLHALAEVAERYSRGFGHVTTRQNIQLHFIKLPDVEIAMRRLADDGMTTREACGNSVRNITACPYAGVASDELFDVTPYAEALTRFFLRHPLSARLPRKFKIAFEGCPEDHAFAAINDLGWTARVREVDGRVERGFRLTVAGGTAIMVTSGRVLFEFLPVAQMLDVAEAVVRVFHKHGDYEHKQRNRMKFLIKTMGWENWRQAFDEALADVRREGSHPLPFDPENPPVEEPPAWARPAAPSVASVRAETSDSLTNGPGIHPPTIPSPGGPVAFSAWRQWNVRPQKQDGFAVALVRLPLGDITSAQFRVLADLSAAYGDGTVRLTPDQNLFIRWVPVNAVSELFERLAAAGLGAPGASTIADVTSCPGAESCKLAVTQSRGLGRLLTTKLAERPGIARDAASASIKISGCPNGCGQHHVSTFGFQGSVRKLDGKAVPQYFVMIGGASDAEGARFGRLVAKVPARRTDEVVERLLDLYRDERLVDETPDAFFKRLDTTRAKAVLKDLETLDAAAATPEDFIDLGEAQAFVPDVQDGECAT
jgi:sulfite reductase (NADPH) hemoprotein beta-component